VDFIQKANGWNLKFQRGDLRLIRIDFRLGLLIMDGVETIDICIETAFTMENKEDNFICTPEDPKSLSPILPLVNSRVDLVVIENSGQLTIHFDSGASIRINPDPSYEAWQLGASSGFLMVCPPEGKVAIFQK
jgi:hypothetical protein